MNKNLILLCYFFVCTQTIFAQKTIELISQGVQTSLRGLSIAKDNSIWVSGSNGYIGRSTDEGASFSFQQLAQYQKSELRDIYAFDSSIALVMSSTSPACILKTVDGGKTWKPVFITDHPNVFLDGFDFWDQTNGICFGDPIQNKFYILYTLNKGDDWIEVDPNYCPSSSNGVAAFAASGSTIQCLKDGGVFIGTGGNESVIYYSENYGKAWEKISTPMQSGYESSGIFSLYFLNAKTGFITGGDYTKENSQTENFFYTNNNGKKWVAAKTMPSGYRSCVIMAGKNLILVCGTNGVDVAYSDFLSFQRISDEGFNVMAADKKGNTVFFAGNNGKIAKLKIK